MEEPRSPYSLNTESHVTGKLSQTVNSKMESSVGKSMERGSTSTQSMKRKRGRPKKLASNGSPIRPSSPLSLSFKRNRGRPRGSSKRIDASSGGGVDDTTGENFLPHVIIVNRGEDIVRRISSFSLKGPRSICILSAHGTISHVTVRQVSSCKTTMTYEGLFEILSLSGSFTVAARGRSGGLSITLAGPDGRVFGGLVAGLLIAASTVQVVVGSFRMSFNELRTKCKFDPSTLFEVPITCLNEVGTTIKATSEITPENESSATPTPTPENEIFAAPTPTPEENEISMTPTPAPENDVPATPIPAPENDVLATPTPAPANVVPATPTPAPENETPPTLAPTPEIKTSETPAPAPMEEDGEAGNPEDDDQNGSSSSMDTVVSHGSPLASE